MQELFIELLQISIGTRKCFSRVPNVHEWDAIYAEAEKQAVLGVIVDGLERLPGNQRPPKIMLLQWIGVVQLMEQTYKIHCERAKELSNSFRIAGFGSCVLKGIGNAQYYPNPQRRQCGDIDIWVEGEREDVIGYVRKRGQIGHVDVKHCDWKVFEDTEVEVHFISTWFYNPFTNKKLQRWIEGQKAIQFDNQSELGINTPTTAFNLVYALIHIYRHLFDEGVGLRQMVDYYYVLKHSTVEERNEALRVLSSLRMKRFVGATMYAMQSVFGMDDGILLCHPSQKEGDFLLNEIMRAGNFGHYDERNIHHQSRWMNGLQNVKRNLRFVLRYPQEVCWMPVWKVWHWCWRKKKGYL